MSSLDWGTCPDSFLQFQSTFSGRCECGWVISYLKSSCEEMLQSPKEVADVCKESSSLMGSGAVCHVSSLLRPEGTHRTAVPTNTELLTSRFEIQANWCNNTRMLPSHNTTPSSHSVSSKCGSPWAQPPLVLKTRRRYHLGNFTSLPSTCVGGLFVQLKCFSRILVFGHSFPVIGEGGLRLQKFLSQ